MLLNHGPALVQVRSGAGLRRGLHVTAGTPRQDLCQELPSSRRTAQRLARKGTTPSGRRAHREAVGQNYREATSLGAGTEPHTGRRPPRPAVRCDGRPSNPLRTFPRCA